jgi:superoxide dismutase, Fe-Mn family
MTPVCPDRAGLDNVQKHGHLSGAGCRLASVPSEGAIVADYTLPDLPYDYSALEPHISGTIMELHHDKHHQTYVTGANTALEKLAGARESGSLDAVNLFEKNLAFNLAGHVNHSVFWPNLSPDGGDKPDGEVAAAIDEHFGSFDGFRAQFEAVALGIQGSGWSLLAWDSIGQKLAIYQLYDHQGNLPVGLTPILLLDMWEHAFYLQYKNVKADYVKAWWNVVNWTDVSSRFDRARTATAGLIVASG